MFSYFREASKLNAIEGFAKEKDALTDRLNCFVKEVESLKSKHTLHCDYLEKTHIIEKSRLKQQMKDKLSECTNELRSSFHRHMNETTRNLIRTNHFLNSNLKKLAGKLDCLINENQTLKEIVKLQYKNNGLLLFFSHCFKFYCF
jgi:NAD-specific glutamate dehydrogenase